MRIAIEARALGRPASGISTYVRELVRALREAAPDDEISLLQEGPTSELLLSLWLNTTVPQWLSKTQPDVVHFTKAALPYQKKFPAVVTIYDVIPLLFPESQKFLPRLLWPITLRHAAHTADHIITISETSKKDIVEQLQVAPEKITVTPLPVNQGMQNSELRVQKYANTTPYILFLGTIEPRKNVPALVRAFAKIAHTIPHNIVIAGRAYKGIDDVHAAIKNSGVAERIQLRNFVPTEELRALYTNASLFVWPSIYEGWGFPPQEAMAAGVPVIVSNGGSLPEVVGEAGEIVPFTAPKIAERTHDEAFEVALADRIVAVLSNPEKQAAMREAGLRQVQKLSWPVTARATLKVYEQVSR